MVIVACAIVARWFINPIINGNGWYNSWEGTHHIFRLIAFRDSFLAGIWYPRWMPNVYKGYGYPSFVFFHPGFFFLTLPFTLVMNLRDATHISLWLSFFIVMLGVYSLARLWNTRWLSLGFATIYLFNPSIRASLFVGGDLPEV